MEAKLATFDPLGYARGLYAGNAFDLARVIENLPEGWHWRALHTTVFKMAYSAEALPLLAEFDALTG